MQIATCKRPPLIRTQVRKELTDVHGSQYERLGAVPSPDARSPGPCPSPSKINALASTRTLAHALINEAIQPFDTFAKGILRLLDDLLLTCYQRFPSSPS